MEGSVIEFRVKIRNEVNLQPLIFVVQAVAHLSRRKKETSLNHAKNLFPICAVY